MWIVVIIAENKYNDNLNAIKIRQSIILCKSTLMLVLYYHYTILVYGLYGIWLNPQQN